MVLVPIFFQWFRKRKNWPTRSFLYVPCVSLWLLWPGHFVFLVLTGRTWVALAHFLSEGAHSLFGHMAPLWRCFSWHLFHDSGQNSSSLGNWMPELSGCLSGPYLEPLVMADCSYRLLSKRQMYSPLRRIPHPASYFCTEPAGTEWWNMA